MHTLQRVVSALCSTALVAAPIAAPAFATPVPASADEPWTVVPEETLRDMRGGIDLGALVANFAIMRVVQVDGGGEFCDESGKAGEGDVEAGADADGRSGEQIERDGAAVLRQSG